MLRSRVTQLEGQLRELDTRLDQLRRDHDTLRTSYTRHTHGLAGLGTSGTFQDTRGEGGAIATYGRTVYVLIVNAADGVRAAGTTPPR